DKFCPTRSCHVRRCIGTSPMTSNSDVWCGRHIYFPRGVLSQIHSDLAVLLARQIKRQEPPYAFLQHLDRREEFMRDLTSTLQEMPFVLIAGAIYKERLKERYAV